ncbi:Tn3 family transposase [Streptomyces sp. NPDC005134]|uniref:Tn3 family transposase n=1 Tax=Streptomyces sp. NPDC005098 TaxID=3154560 RepID=UPI0033A94BFF
MRPGASTGYGPSWTSTPLACDDLERHRVRASRLDQAGLAGSGTRICRVVVSLPQALGFARAGRPHSRRVGSSDVAVPNGQEPAGDYGSLEAIARNRVNLKRITTHWPDMLCVAGALITNQVRAYDLLRMFGREGHPTSLGAAFAEYGRIDKTMHLLALVDPMDDTYRRLMNRQLTVQESRHRLARAVCHGGRGQIRQAYRDGQEDQLATLGLVLNAVVLWNTRYLDAAVAQLRAEGHDLNDEDAARLSPLKDRHINSMGRYQFNFAASGPGEGLRPLRDPDAPELDEDDDGGRD